MKLLSTRLQAPISVAQAATTNISQFTAKKINHVVKMPQRLVGQWRLYLNYCPECNSCAPKMHQCEVCNADTRAFFHWNDEIRKTWWKKYAEKHRIAL